MLKKILLITGSIFSGVNLGIISCASPFYLVVMVLLNMTSADLGFFAATSIITAVIVGIITYIYTYKRKREHEKVSPYIASFAWSFVAGAIIMAAIMFVMISQSQFDIGPNLR